MPNSSQFSGVHGLHHPLPDAHELLALLILDEEYFAKLADYENSRAHLREHSNVNHLQEVCYVQVFLVFGAEKMQHQENAQESQDIVAKCARTNLFIWKTASNCTMTASCVYCDFS